MKKAQSWYIDYIISFVIFVGVFFLLMANLPSMNSDSMDDIIFEVDMLSDSLLSEGVPSNWNKTNVVQIGLLTDLKLDENKLNLFSTLNYSDVRNIQGLKYDFILFFEKENSDYTINGFDYFGPIDANRTNIDSFFEPDKIVHLTRIIASKGDIIAMHLVMWS